MSLISASGPAHRLRWIRPDFFATSAAETPRLQRVRLIRGGGGIVGAGIVWHGRQWCVNWRTR